MARFPHVGAGMEVGQMVSNANARSIDPGAVLGLTNRILLMAGAAGAYFGDSGVSTTTGFAIPTTGPVELWQNTPSEIFIIGGGAIVYYYLELVEGDQ